MSINCENNYLSLDKQVQTLLRTDGTLNGLAVNVITLPVDAEPALNCDKNNLTFVQLLMLCFVVDSCGKPAINAAFIQSCDLVKTCDNNPYSFLNSIFGYSPALKQYFIIFVEPTP